MSAYIRAASRTPAEVLNSLHYRVHELDIDRLWQAQQAVDLLALLDTSQPSPFTLDHVAAVAAYVADDLRQVLGNAHRAGGTPDEDLADTL
jgi:hypothetical protein